MPHLSPMMWLSIYFMIMYSLIYICVKIFHLHPTLKCCSVA